jgi:hypothetical protein
MFLAGFIQKTIKADPIVKSNHIYPRRNQRRKTIEQSRKQCTMTQLEWPIGLWPVGLWDCPISLCFNVGSPPPLRINLTPLLKVGSYRGLRFDIVMDSWVHRIPGSPYIRPPILPLLRHRPAFNPPSRRRTSKLHKYS